MAANRPACARLLAVAPAGRSAASYTITRDTTLIVERTFAWISRKRRLARDFDLEPSLLSSASP